MKSLLMWLIGIAWAAHLGWLGDLQTPWHPWMAWVFWALFFSGPLTLYIKEQRK